MWLLMLVFLSLHHQDVVLKEFATVQACAKERERIGFEMAEAYPLLEEMDFRIECQFRAVSNRLILAAN